MVRRAVGWALLVAVAAAGLLRAPTMLDAHPLHTTITELTEQRAAGTVRAVVRAFADDFGTAVSRQARGRRGGASAADDAALAYASARFGLVGGDGRALVLRSCGVRRTSDLVWICLEASAEDAERVAAVLLEEEAGVGRGPLR